MIIFLGKLPPPIGGVTIINEELSSFCERKESIQFFDYSKIFKLKQLKKLILLIVKGKIICLNCSLKSFKYIVPLIVFILNIFKLKIFLRLFGGDIYKTGKLFKFYDYFYALLGVKTIFVETQESIEFIKKIALNKRCKYEKLINSRERHLELSYENQLSKINKEKIPFIKFVYLGQIKTSKGIDLICNASKNLKGRFKIDFFGPLVEKEMGKLIDETKNCFYKGIIFYKEVQKELLNYDCLILPTSYSGEGHPGVILEAQHAGLAMIVSNIKSIKEITSGKCALYCSTKKDDLHEKMNLLINDLDKLKNLKRGSINFSKKSNFSNAQKLINLINKKS